MSVRAYRGESVAAALHASGQQVLSRSLKYHRPRSFFCLSGHCSGCLMRIDGVPNRRACMEPCRDGLEVAGQNAYPTPDLDVLEVVDWMFPKGMDHHTLMTGSAVLNAVAQRVVRQLSGLGELPARPPGIEEAIVPATWVEPDVLVIGAGPAGLAAATEAARAGAQTVLIDEHDRAGGSLLTDPRYGVADAQTRLADARAAGVDVRLGHTAVGYFPEDNKPMLAAASARALTLFTPSRFVYATGGYAVNRLFANNDRPGVMAARAVGRLLVGHGITAGNRICLVSDTDDDYAAALHAALERVGCEVIAAREPDIRVVGAHGRSWVTGVELVSGNGSDAGQERRVECEVIAVSATPSPASEAPRQHGCDVGFHPAAGGFAVLVDDRGQTTVDNVLACGDVCGYLGPDRAAEMGQIVGRNAAEECV